jgi:hypothetical protein
MSLILCVYSIKVQLYLIGTGRVDSERRRKGVQKVKKKGFWTDKRKEKGEEKKRKQKKNAGRKERAGSGEMACGSSFCRSRL